MPPLTINHHLRFVSFQYLNVGIKWPNDLYASGNIKIGGLIVKSILQGKSAVVNVGVGVNLNNSNPTTCLNDLIRLENMNFNSNIPYISYERYFATVFNHVEKIFNIVQGGDMDYFYDLYYQYWLHKYTSSSTYKLSVSTIIWLVLGMPK